MRASARNPEIVSIFNRFFGAQLRAPIAALLNEERIEDAPEEEQVQIACFIGFVRAFLWGRQRRATRLLGQALHRLTVDLR